MKHIFFLFLCLYTFPLFAESRVIKICWEDKLKPPYLKFDFNRNKEPLDGQIPTGLSADILLNSLKDLKEIKIKHVFLPWKRCLNEIEKGNVDIVPNTLHLEEREKFAYFSDQPMYTTHLVFLYSIAEFPNAPILKTLDNIKKYTVGGIIGHNYSFFENRVKMNLHSSDRMELVSGLLQNKYPLALEQLELMKNLEKDKMINLKGIGFIPSPVESEKSYFVMFGKKTKYSAELKLLYDSGFQKIATNGTLEKLSHEYF